MILMVMLEGRCLFRRSGVMFPTYEREKTLVGFERAEGTHEKACNEGAGLRVE